jgi:hypothetical protein
LLFRVGVQHIPISVHPGKIIHPARPLFETDSQ